MKQRIEDYIFNKVKANISEDLKALLVKGHSNLERKSPYICIDVSECKCFEGLDWNDGLYELSLNISIADSAYDIDYTIQSKRRREVENLMNEINFSSENFLLNYINLDEASDARDENNIGDVLSYTLYMQAL